MKAKTEDRAPYNVAPDGEDEIIARALDILASRMRYASDVLGSPGTVRDFLRLKLAGLEHEVFSAILLDFQNKLISYDELFRGTLAQTSVYPREVVKLALKHNAASVIFAHNHPSGVATPSRADELLTGTLKTALSLVDVKVLDHMIVAGRDIISMAERGMV